MDYWVITAGALTLVSVALSSYEIIRHFTNFTKPHLQRYIVRILLMVPIYSLNAWVAMIIPATGLYLDSGREVYESFVIYSFMKYLLNWLKYETDLKHYISQKPGPSHIFPLCCLPNCQGGKRFLTRCKHGILQYVLIRPLTSLIAFVSQIFGFYGEGNYNPFSGYTYPVLLLINNASQVTAMYCLVIFYTAYRQELSPMQPLAKFFSIKLVVFFSFFQSVVISALLEVEMIEETFRLLFPDITDKVSLGRKVQELFICFDMMIAAVGHLFAFTYKPFVERYETDSNLRNLLRASSSNILNDSSCCSAIWSTLDFSDERNDLNQIYRRITTALGFQRPALPGVSQSNDGLYEDWTSRNTLDGDESNQNLINNQMSPDQKGYKTMK